MRFLQCVAVLLILSAAATAKVDIQRKNGEEIVVTFADDKVAIVQLTKHKPVIAKVPFQVTDSSCSTRVGALCQIHGGVAVDTFSLVWTKHPDATRIGKRVFVKSPFPAAPPETPLDASFLYSLPEKAKYPILASSVPNSKIVCTDYSWLPGEPKSAPAQVKLTRWDVEMMFRNPETELMENRTLALGSNLELKANSEGELEIQSKGVFVGQLFELFFGDNWALVLPHPDGDYCHATLKADNSKFIDSLAGLGTPAGPATPYIWGSDEYSTVLNFNVGFFLGIFLNNPEQYEIL